MNVFRAYRGYRRFGLNYGLPVFFVDFGVGVSYTPTDLIRKLVGIGLDKGSWVVVRNSLGERGIGDFVEGLKYIGTRVEVEGNGTYKTPGWFPMVDRWIVYYREGGVFNYGALRARQDMLICEDEVDLEKTEKLLALRVLIVDDPEAVWDRVKDKEVRVYKEKGDV